jgi:hypothetical protein
MLDDAVMTIRIPSVKNTVMPGPRIESEGDPGIQRLDRRVKPGALLFCDIAISSTKDASPADLIRGSMVQAARWMPESSPGMTQEGIAAHLGTRRPLHWQ